MYGLPSSGEGAPSASLHSVLSAAGWRSVALGSHAELQLLHAACGTASLEPCAAESEILEAAARASAARRAFVWLTLRGVWDAHAKGGAAARAEALELAREQLERLYAQLPPNILFVVVGTGAPADSRVPEQLQRHGSGGRPHGCLALAVSGGASSG
mgnify:CR=1 FL=1